MGDYVERKIKYKDWALLRGYTKEHKDEKRFYNFYIYHYDNRCFKIWGRMKLWVYLLLFIPAHVIQFFYLLWDGGICKFGIEDRPVKYSYFYPDSAKYDLCYKVIGIEPQQAHSLYQMFNI